MKHRAAPHRHFLIPLGAAVLALALLASLTGCGKKEPAAGSQSGSSSASRPSAASSSASDYSKPALTADKITRFIDSMNEERNPLEFIFRKGGQVRSLAEMNAKAAELNAFAQKYGFKDYTDYLDTWGRITVGTMQLASSKMMKGFSEMMEKNVKQAEENLKKPNLSPAERQMYTEQLESARKSAAEMAKPRGESALNQADLSLVEKYAAQIEEASKKYRQKQGAQ